ncbi:NAD(P)-dependent oxidoreductase [Chitinophaga arvensicola]|uniref:Putative NADH-flavin reductase n=1 Tax=Chitinophaga arvensicola TaxID=29529 RepID=A0A1I0QDQ2_9BACT|nr:SDR family oxidoreductase [Chitinophaga arvensicola]SEW25177.1 Putative NADH-flavin reductase [Chitinophaga arvensicola]
MKLLIFGATGGTGRELVTQALRQGHTVTAFVRNPSLVQQQHPQLTIVKGDVLDYNTIEPAIAGHDAVLSAIGMPANKTGVLRSEGTRNIIRAMEKKGLKRFICQTSLGYGDSREVLNRTPFIFKYIIVPFILKKGFADHALQEQYIKGSSLDWVIVRPGNLTDGELTGRYRYGFAPTDPNITVKVSRADVADFMLKQLNDSRFIHQTPGISYWK